ncbi:type III-B CRISPR module RAMP protein Cmr6 [Thermus thalpophilus]
MSRRRSLEGVSHQPGSTHAGLWLDKYLSETSREDTEAKRKLVRDVAELGEPPGYKEFFQRYREALKEVGAEVRQAKTLGRLVVGLGGEGVLETTLTLHQVYGVPYIPGSALKGLASRYAHLYLEGEAWRRNLANFARGEAQAGLFGTTEEGGAVVFFDALPLPGTWRLHPDILNPHHREYYGTGEEPPADWDSPVPVPFLSVTGSFLVALAPAPGVALEDARPWLEAAWKILGWALTEEGVGAKTASGYGRMELEGLGVQGQGGDATFSLRPEYEALRTRLQAISYRGLRAFLEKEAKTILTLSPEELASFKEALGAKGFLKNPRDLREWAKASLEVRQVLEKLGVL